MADPDMTPQTPRPGGPSEEQIQELKAKAERAEQRRLERAEEAAEHILTSAKGLASEHDVELETALTATVVAFQTTQLDARDLEADDFMSGIGSEVH